MSQRKKQICWKQIAKPAPLHFILIWFTKSILKNHRALLILRETFRVQTHPSLSSRSICSTYQKTRLDLYHVWHALWPGSLGDHMWDRSTPVMTKEVSIFPPTCSSVLSLSFFKSVSFCWQKHCKGSFYLPAAISCQNTQVAASSTINMMYGAYDASDLTTRTAAVRGSRCHADLWHSTRTFTLDVLSCPGGQSPDNEGWTHSLLRDKSACGRNTCEFKMVWLCVRMCYNNFARGNWHCWTFFSHPLVWKASLESFTGLLVHNLSKTWHFLSFWNKTFCLSYIIWFCWKQKNSS